MPLIGPLHKFAKDHPNTPLFISEADQFVCHQVHRHGITMLIGLQGYSRVRDAKRALKRLGYEQTGNCWKRPVTDAASSEATPQTDLQKSEESGTLDGEHSASAAVASGSWFDLHSD